MEARVLEPAKATLPLESLEIRDFRAFDQLRIERLMRVNLVVGKNGVGKSTLLEAVRLYANRGSLSVIEKILYARDEEAPLPAFSGKQEAQNKLLPIKYLFHGREDVGLHRGPLLIGPLSRPAEALSIEGVFFYAKGKGYEQITNLDELRTLNKPVVPGLAIRLGSSFRIDQPLDKEDFQASTAISLQPPIAPCVFVFNDGLRMDETAELWDSIVLTELENDVLKALQIIDPDVERVSITTGAIRMVERTDMSRGPRKREKEPEVDRVPIAKMKGLGEPVTLLSLGDGMNHLFGIALALVNAKDGILLIDEVENGIHYSAQEQLWQLILEVAARLNVQVFATTHSWDCIDAFQRAMRHGLEPEGQMIRLQRERGSVLATLFDARKLNIATREDIEVR
jgi:ABC-type branched-subunit amino acid transport system ATPase component